MTEKIEYRVYVQVPHMYREGTRGRLLTTRDSYSDVGDLADYLVESMVHSGIDRDQARAWVATHLDVRRVETEISMSTPEPMPMGP